MKFHLIRSRAGKKKMMDRTYQVFEHSMLRCEPGRKGYEVWFTARHLEAMVDYHDNRGGSKYFKLVRSGVQFSQYVGVMQVLDLTIEILPKTDRSESKSDWHNVLLSMLRQTRFLQLNYISEASLRYKKYSILHLYFQEYINQVRGLVRKGLIRKYRRKEGNLFALKGSLKFNQHINQNLVHKERFYTMHQVYDHNHLIHQVLYKALGIIQSLTKNSFITDDLNRLLFEFPEMPFVSVTEKTFEKINLDRKSSSYSKALEIAKMIILNYSPDIKGGRNDLFALLFDMNELWEEYIYRQLIASGYSVKYQDSQLFWKLRRMRPDMVVNIDGENQIVDAKWKIVNNAQPSDEDLRQVFAYNIYWGAKKGFLVYPKTSLSPIASPGYYHKGHTSDEKMSCQVMYVDALIQGQYNLEL